MNKNSNSILTIIILVLIGVSIAFAYPALATPQKLNANNGNNNNNNTTPVFEFISSRPSALEYIDWENNFGGTGNESISQSYHLDFTYIIGTTTSKTHYMQNNVADSNIYILKISRSGNLISVTLPSIQKNETFAKSYATSLGIYILSSHHNGFTAFFYSFASESITTLFTQDGYEPQEIFADDSLTVLATKNNKLHIFNYNLQTKQISMGESELFVTEVMLATAYKQGFLLFANTNNAFTAIYINNLSYEYLLVEPEFKLLDFNITQQGFLFILQSDSKIKTLFTDQSFNQTNSQTISKTGSYYNYLFINNVNYLFYINSNQQVYTIIISEKGDIVFNLSLNISAFSILHAKHLNNGIYLATQTIESNLKITLLSQLTLVVSESIFTLSPSTTVADFQLNTDSSITIYGTTNTSNTVIKHNFGSYDVFAIKFSNK